ncbi:MAG: hypothetical protein GXY84_08005 [Clostridiales bacterium]|nr:hypothetical protein [Clostridiales bacterium]
MQGKETRKTKTPARQAVKKPYLKGRAFSPLAIRRGLRVLSYLLVSAVLYFFLGQLMVIDLTWLRVLINLGVISAFCALLFGTGARDGEGDVSFAEIAWNRREQGQTVSQDDLAKCFHPLKGFVTALAGALPLVLLCLVYALMAVKDTYTLGALPGWLAGYQQRADIGLALSYYHDRAGFGLNDLLRLVVRLLVFPFVNMVGSRNVEGLLLIERLSPLLVLVPPLFYGLGYWRGENYRARVHGGIAANARRQARRRKKKQQPRRQEPRQLV